MHLLQSSPEKPETPHREYDAEDWINYFGLSWEGGTLIDWEIIKGYLVLYSQSQMAFTINGLLITGLDNEGCFEFTATANLQIARIS